MCNHDITTIPFNREIKHPVYLSNDFTGLETATLHTIFGGGVMQISSLLLIVEK